MSVFPLIGLVVVVLGLLSLALSHLRIDWTPGRYKVIFHEGPDIGLKTKVASGWLVIEDGIIKIDAPQPVKLPLASVVSVELFRLQGSMRMIRITHDQGTLFVTDASLPLNVER